MKRLPLRELLSHRWLTVRVQIALGVIFVIAALPKIADPPGFTQMIYNYRLVPGPLLNIMALGMPWFELIAGVALIIGVWRRTAALLIGALLVVFIVAIGINLARGNAIDCGCFDTSKANLTHEQRLDDMRSVIIRDLGMLLMVAQIVYAERKLNEAVPDHHRAVPDQVGRGDQVPAS
jgi:putative oxidoreductase